MVAILSLSSYYFVSIRDLTATVAAYFLLPTYSAYREEEHIWDSIRNTFNVENLQVVDFLDLSGKLTLVSDLANRKVDITFFTFRSAATASDIDQHFSST